MKTKVSHRLSARFNVGLLAVSSLILVGGALLPGLRSVVVADQYDAQIKALQQQNSNTQSTVSGLQQQAASYQDAISQLQSQIDSVQATIDGNLAQQADLQQKISDDQAQIDKQKAILSDDIKSMYVDGTPSTLEVLATSKNLSDFVDKQQYRTTVQNKLQATVKTITGLQTQLVTQKAKLNQLLDDLKSQQAQLDGDRAQQASLLAYNQDQQSSYNSQIAANNAQVNKLRQQQAAALAAITGSGGTSAVGSSIVYHNMSAQQYCGGGYDYCNYSLDQWVNDPWGLDDARECVHYVADVLKNRGYYIPYGLFSGRGNANQWVGTTTSTGTATLVTDPQADDVVYLPLAPLGHVAIVDYVNANGTLHVSQMNWGPGMYSTMDLTITSNLRFLRFHK